MNKIDRHVLQSSVLASSMAFIDGGALNVALPQIQSTLQTTAAQLLWINNSYLIVLAALVLPGGSLGDRLGRKRVFTWGIWIFIVGSLFCGFSANVDFLILSRILQGIGAAMMIPGSLAVLSTHFSDKERGRAIGLWSAFTAATTIAGPILGGFFADAGIWVNIVGNWAATQFWRAIFFINLPLALIALRSLRKYVAESRDESLRASWPDFGGALLLASSLGSISYSLIHSAEGRLGENSSTEGGLAENSLAKNSLAEGGLVKDGLAKGGAEGDLMESTFMGVGMGADMALLLFGLLAMGLFIIWELRIKNPMMPMRLYRSSVFTGTNLITLFLYGGLQGAFLFFSLNLVQIQDYSASIAGFAIAPFVLMLILISRAAGQLSDNHGPRLPLIVGPAFTGAGVLFMGLPGITGGAADYWVTYFPGILFVGIGMGITVAPLTAAMISSVPKENSGAASGVNNALSRIAAVLAIAFMGSLVLKNFDTSFTARIAEISLPDDTRRLLLANSSDMGNMELPSNLSAETWNALRRAVQLSFVDACRLGMWIAALLAWISSLCALFFIRTGVVSHDFFRAD